MGIAADEQALEKSYEAWNTGDVDLFDEFLAPDVRYHLSYFPDVDLAGLKQLVAATRSASPDFEVHEEDRIAQGDMVCSRWTCSATFTSANPIFPAIPPTGKGQTTWGILMFRWEGGKAVEVWHSWDALGWLTQQGVIPPLA